MEVWKPIKNYEGLYEVSDIGRVRSLTRVDRIGRVRKGQLLKPHSDGRGYLFVGLNKDGKCKQFHIHRLVAMAFLGEAQEGYTVNHIDENKRNNNADNLECLTRLENYRYGTAIKRMGEKHRKPIVATIIDGGQHEYYESLNAAAEALDGDRSNIGHALHGRQNYAYGRTWKFVEAGR